MAAILYFMYVTAILNFENDENVFFVPKNVEIDTSITITGSIQCHILIWSKSVILAAILNFWAHGSHILFWNYCNRFVMAENI